MISMHIIIRYILFFSEAEQKRIKEKYKRKKRKKNRKNSSAILSRSMHEKRSNTGDIMIGNEIDEKNEKDDDQFEFEKTNHVKHFDDNDEEEFSSCSLIHNHKPVSSGRLYMPGLVYLYDMSYIKYFEGVGYPRFAVDILETAKFWIKEATEESETNPAFDICNVRVKISDLGNACWVVGIH